MSTTMHLRTSLSILGSALALILLQTIFDEAWAVSPAYSAPIPLATSCSRLAFTSNRDGNYEIYMMNADSTGQTRLTNNSAADYNPSLSHDGTRIAFTSQRDGNAEIYMMNADGTGQTRLTNNPFDDDAPVFSPDGTKIAFSSARDGNHEIYLMNTDGSGITPLTNHPAVDFSPAFSPDGTKITFASRRASDGNYNIYVMNADGSGQTRLTDHPADDGTPEFSPDGTKIVFLSARDPGDFEIYLMNADGSNQVNLTNNPTADYFPTFSPDGTKIAFASRRDGNDEIYVMNVDGTHQENITSLSCFEDSGPSWGSCPGGFPLPPAALPPCATPTPTPTPPPDSDSDGVLDTNDNCPMVANPCQEDADGDGFGDACDSAPDCPGVEPPAGMVAWWPGDGNAQDLQGPTFEHGALHNGASADAPGQVGPAFNLGGSLDRVQIPHSPNLDFTSGDEYSVEFWMKAPPHSNWHPALVEKWSEFTNGSYPYVVRLNTGAFGPPGTVFVAAFDGVSTRSVDSVGRVDDNVWHHVAAVFRHSQKRIEVYVDGLLDHSSTYSTIGSISNSDPISFGIRPAPTSARESLFDYDGLLDEVSIYGRALSASEVKAIYDAGSAGKCKVLDSDGDGVNDGVDNCPALPNSDQINNDGDSQGDACDDDDDNDGVLDGADNCLFVSNADQTDTDSDGQGDACDTDDDDDTIADANDNCPLASNTNQANNDGDSQGDVCDPDDDNDTVADGADNCLLVQNTDQSNNDGDALGDACDPDDDNDGIADGADNCQFTSNPDQANNDGDTLGNVCDSDDDNDGVFDNVDNCPTTPNPDQRDTNGDGVGDLCTTFQLPADGLFVIGDLVNLSGGSTVNFWGSQWAKNNPMTGGTGPNAFKGFENGMMTPQCGATWTSQSGSSSSPPATIPQFMAVIVSSSVQKNGSVITGDVKRVLVIRTNSGYGPSPGHWGTGQVVAVLCEVP